MKKWFSEMISSQGEVSSKRVVTVLSFLLLAIGFLCNLFLGYTVLEFMYNTISYITIAGLGFTASEFFSNNKNKDKKDETSDNDDNIK